MGVLEYHKQTNFGVLWKYSSGWSLESLQAGESWMHSEMSSLMMILAALESLPIYYVLVVQQRYYPSVF